MNGYTLTRVWEIDGQLVIADTIEEAIALYKTYIGKDYYNEPISVKGVHSDSYPVSQMDYAAIIKEEK